MAHQTWPSSAAFSPDGKTVLTRSWSTRSRRRRTTPRLWDATTGLPIGQSLLDEGAIASNASFAFSPNGRTLIGAGGSRTAQLWDIASGQPIGQSLEHKGFSRSVAFSPDGTSILSYDGSGARLWDAVPPQRIGRPIPHQGIVTSVTFGPDGKTVLIVDPDSQRARLWDVATGQPIGRPLELPTQGRLDVRRISMTPVSLNRKTVLIADTDRTCQLWDTATGQSIGKPLTHRGKINAVAFSPDGKTVLTGSMDATGRLWDATTGQPIGAPLVHRAMVLAVAFSPDGKVALTGGLDSTARLWNAATGQSIGKPLVCSEQVDAVGFSPDGKIIFTTSAVGMVREWDAATGYLIRQARAHQKSNKDTTSSSAGETAHGGIEVTTMQTPDDTNTSHADPILSRRSTDTLDEPTSPDGHTVLAQGANRRTWLLDRATRVPIGPPLSDQGLDNVHPASSLFSPDGKLFLTEDLAWAEDPERRGLLRLWKVHDLPNDFHRIVAWVAVLTGLELDAEGNSRPIDHVAWQEWRERLRSLGGPPMTDQDEWADPILYGPDPLSRARAWIDRKQWVEAEVAFDEVVRAWPEIGSFWAERGRFSSRLPSRGSRNRPRSGFRAGRSRLEIFRRNRRQRCDLRSGYRAIASPRSVAPAFPR